MNVSMTLTLDGMLRALRGRVHTLAEEIELTRRPDPDSEPVRSERSELRPREDRPR